MSQPRSAPGPRTGRTWLGLVLSLVILANPAATLAKGHEGKPPGPSTQEELLARAKISQEEAMGIAQETFAVPGDAALVVAQLELPWETEAPIWNLTWNLSGSPGRQLRVGINAVTGQVRWMSLEDPQLWRPGPVELTVNREQAQAIAEALLQQVAPEEFAASQLEPYHPPGPGAEPARTHWFNWSRVVEGIPFPEHSLSVSVSARDGTVISFNRHWPGQVTFAPAAGLISEEQAWEKLNPVIAPQLVYRRLGEGAAASYRLFYRAEPNARVDARTGEVYTPQGSFFQVGEPVSQGGVEPAPRKPLKTAEEAAAVARQVLGLDPEVKPNNTDQWAGGSDSSERFWNIQFRLPGPKPETYRHANVTLNAATGRLQGLWAEQAVDVQNQEPTIDEARAREVALQFVRTFFAPELPELFMRVISGKAHFAPGPEGKAREKVIAYHINFNRVVNGLLVEGESISLTINAFTGEVENLHLNWGQSVLSEPQNPLSVEAARDIWWERFELRRIYVSRPRYEDYPGPPAAEREAVPVWQLSFRDGRPAPSPYIDATTGRFVDWQGVEVLDPARLPEDILEHPQQEALETLAARRALELRDGKLRPDDPLTRLEAVILLNRGLFANGKGAYWETAVPPGAYPDIPQGHPHYWEIHQALSRGILTAPQSDQPFNPDQAVSRAEFAQMLARGLGLGLVEQVTRPLPLGYSDADELPLAVRNPVAMLAGLGIIDDSQGAFQPDQPITRAEAAAQVQATHKLQQGSSPRWGK